MTKLSTILDEIDSGGILLPEFQRGYVWNRDQVRGLMRSLYRGYPVGGLLFWQTETDAESVRGDTAGGGVRRLLLDGQQRITSLYGVIRGRPPAFFEGNPAAFTGLRFNVEDETFEFYAPAKMRDDDRWVDVTSLFTEGLGPHITRFAGEPDKLQVYLERLNRLHQLLQRDFHEEKITGRDKTVDVVVDIFNRVNSGGTELSKGDLALAKLCAQWPGARKVMRDHLARWKSVGFTFSLDWLLRNATAVATGRAVFTALDTVSAKDFEKALTDSARYVGAFLDAVSGRLGLDHDRVLMGRYAFPVVSRLLHLSGGRFTDAVQRDRVLFWYIHTALWGRFAGSTETVLAQDYETVERSGVDGLIATLERWRGGNLDIQPHDFEGSTRGSRFYPLLYLLTRVKAPVTWAAGWSCAPRCSGTSRRCRCTTSSRRPCCTGPVSSAATSTRSRTSASSPRPPTSPWATGDPRTTSPRPRRNTRGCWPRSGSPPTRTCGGWSATVTSSPRGGNCWPTRRRRSWPSSAPVRRRIRPSCGR